jgi:hypothetical protein
MTNPVPVDARTLVLALVAVASGAFAGLGFALLRWLEPFAPCRVPYRQPRAVYESLACQIHAAITLFSLLLACAAAVLVVAAVVTNILNRRRAALPEAASRPLRRRPPPPTP